MNTEILVAQSVAEFVTTVSDIRNEWSSASEEWVDPWFRGQADAEWQLIPGLYRFKEADEHELRSDFERRARPLAVEEKLFTPWDWYFFGQHYGMPTRLLDWTEGSLLALYFAIRSGISGRDAAVWALDPWWLNTQVLNKNEVMLPTEPEITPYLPHIFSKETLPPFPTAIAAPHVSRRMAVQRACFTIHGRIPDGFSEVAKDGDMKGLAKIVVPHQKLPSIQKDLHTCGISETTVFYDLEGLVRELKGDWTKVKIGTSKTLP